MTASSDNASQRLMYVCTSCAENEPEGCGHYDRNDLRVMPNGDWLCEGCFDNTDQDDRGNFDVDDYRHWGDMPIPPQYALAANSPASLIAPNANLLRYSPEIDIDAATGTADDQGLFAQPESSSPTVEWRKALEPLAALQHDLELLAQEESLERAEARTWMLTARRIAKIRHNLLALADSSGKGDGREAGGNERHYLAAIKVRLSQLYTEHPEDARLREQISDEVDWIDERLGRDVRSK